MRSQSISTRPAKAGRPGYVACMGLLGLSFALLAVAACSGSTTSDVPSADGTATEPVEPVPPAGPEPLPTPVEPPPATGGPSTSPQPAEPTTVPAEPTPPPPPIAPLPGSDSGMLVGFHDDRTFLLLESRDVSMDQATSLGANLLRTYAVWEQIAPTRPANASDPHDPAYDWTFHDALVRSADARGIRVLMTIWTTPEWANDGRGDSAAPTDLQDLVDFSFALARRYSGEFEDIPAVQTFTVWNEPNLNRFLTPQFDEEGRSVAPATYAAMYRAAYLGLKSGNPDALVAILEVSPRGRDRPGDRPTRDSHSPGRFAELVAEACDGQCDFDAVAWHPYSPSLAGAPTSRVRWPNANLPELDRFADSLAEWFQLETRPRIWITEYGHQTNPPREGGVSADEQARYLEEALRISNESGLVDMFVWFIFQDDPTSEPTHWEAAGGLIDREAQPKPSFARLAETLASFEPS